MTRYGPALLLLLVGCTAEDPGYVLDLPEGFPAPVIPEENPLTEAKVELGRYLFYEVRLSGNETQSCGSCHFQELAFTDGLEVGEGSTGELHSRNVNALTNVAYNSTLTWANPLLTDLETQMLLPLFADAPVEMGASPGEDEVLARIQSDPVYTERFIEAYPELDEPVTWDTTIAAISSFMRTMISGDSPFDQFALQQDTTALTETELRGLELFFSERLECHHCHGGFNFSEASTHAGSAFESALFHNTGLYNVDGEGAYPANNTGIYAVTGQPGDMGRFRPPSLRNVGVTAPYLHDGSAATLEEVIRIYEAGGRDVQDGPNAGNGSESPLKSGLVAGFELTDQERADLVAFLESLTDPTFLNDPRFSPAMILLLTAALAHHDTAVSQVGPQASAGSLFDDIVDRPHLELGVAYDVLSFSRMLRGSDRFAADSSVTVHGVALTARALLPTGTTATLRVPTGLMITRTDRLETKPRAGLADISLSAQQRVGAWSAQLGVSAPTGAYSGNAEVSITDAEGEDGQILLTTYDTRASLGTGAWSGAVALGGDWSDERFGVSGRVGAQVPFTDTPDDVRWGSTFSGALGGRVQAVQDRISLGLSADVRHHRPDRMLGIDEQTGDLVTLRPGTRSAVGLQASVMARLGPKTRCGISAHAPVWQHVDGVQLVEAASGSLSCRQAWAIGKEGRRAASSAETETRAEPVEQ